MKFLAIIYNDESRYADATPEDIAATFAGARRVRRGGRQGRRVRWAARACSRSPRRRRVRVRDGERMLTDGPYAETKEQLGGYYLLECKDLDEALNWAAQIPEAKTGAVEVRPVMDYEAMGSAEPDRTAGQTSSSTACSGVSRDRRSPSSRASSATSTAPRRRCRTRSSPRSSAGRATGCRTTRRPGSSPRRATARSTGSAPSALGRAARRARGRAAGARRRRGRREEPSS